MALCVCGTHPHDLVQVSLDLLAGHLQRAHGLRHVAWPPVVKVREALGHDLQCVCVCVCVKKETFEQIKQFVCACKCIVTVARWDTICRVRAK